ncbi:hypothetical protein ACFL0T_08425 [Candidatus Omnitrophota bacterium]
MATKQGEKERKMWHKYSIRKKTSILIFNIIVILVITFLSIWAIIAKWWSVRLVFCVLFLPFYCFYTYRMAKDISVEKKQNLVK